MQKLHIPESKESAQLTVKDLQQVEYYGAYINA